MKSGIGREHLAAAIAERYDLIGLDPSSGFHTWRPERHTGHRETFHPVGPFCEQALDVGGGHVAFNDVPIRDHGMTRTKVIGDAVLRLYRRHVGVIDRGDGMTVALLHMRGPGFAASAAGIAIHGEAGRLRRACTGREQYRAQYGKQRVAGRISVEAHQLCPIAFMSSSDMVDMSWPACGSAAGVAAAVGVGVATRAGVGLRAEGAGVRVVEGCGTDAATGVSFVGSATSSVTGSEATGADVAITASAARVSSSTGRRHHHMLPAGAGAQAQATILRRMRGFLNAWQAPSEFEVIEAVSEFPAHEALNDQQCRDQEKRETKSNAGLRISVSDPC